MLISFLLLHLQCAIAIDLIPQGVALGYGLYGLSARFSGQQYYYILSRCAKIAVVSLYHPYGVRV